MTAGRGVSGRRDRAHEVENNPVRLDLERRRRSRLLGSDDCGQSEAVHENGSSKQAGRPGERMRGRTVGNRSDEDRSGTDERSEPKAKHGAVRSLKVCYIFAQQGVRALAR